MIFAGFLSGLMVWFFGPMLQVPRFETGRERRVEEEKNEVFQNTSLFIFIILIFLYRIFMIT